MMQATDWQGEVLKRLDALAAKLDTTAAHLWQVLVRQAHYEGIANIALGVAIACVFGVGIYMILRALKIPNIKNSYNGHDEWPESKGPIFGFGVAIVIFAGVGMTLAFYTGFLLLVNPEFGALQKLAEIFHAGG